MPPRQHHLSLGDDEEKQAESTAIEPLILVPPTVSTLSLENISFESDSLEPIGCFQRFAGIIYSLISSFLFTCSTFSIKQLGVDLLDALLLRFVIQTFATFIFVYYKDYQLLPGTKLQIFLQIWCCATGAGSFFLYFCAIRYVDLSDVMTLCYTRVVWTMVFSIIAYRERPSWGSIIALPLTLLGVIFVSQPSFFFGSISRISGSTRLLGSSLSIISAMVSASNVLLFKQLISTSKDIKPSVLNFQYCTAVLIFLICYQCYKSFVLHVGLSWNFIISWRYICASLVCLVMIIVNILTQKAIKREHPAVFTLLGSADIIFSLILQNLFTSKRSNAFALLGSALVICSVLIIGVSKILHERRERKQLKSIDKENSIEQ